MDTTILIILGIILVCLVILNYINMIQTSTYQVDERSIRASCAQTAFGCCPDGVNSKINFHGTNCPSYRPGPGYYRTSYPKEPTQYSE
jgi:hypothetical protein